MKSSACSRFIFIPIFIMNYLNSGLGILPSLSLSSFFNYSIKSSTVSLSFNFSSITSRSLAKVKKPKRSGSIYLVRNSNSSSLGSKSRALIIVLNSMMET
jgi:hypothetical protein